MNFFSLFNLCIKIGLEKAQESCHHFKRQQHHQAGSFSWLGGGADGAGVLGGGAGGDPGAEWAVCGAAQEVDHWSGAVRQPISHLHG